jgi:hypothetical protein
MLRSGTSLSRGLLLSRISTLHRRAIRPLGVGASVGADCSRRPGIDRYRATATAPDCVLWQHGARGADTQRNSLPLVTDQKVGGSNPSGRALLRQTIQAPDQRKRCVGALLVSLPLRPSGSSSARRPSTSRARASCLPRTLTGIIVSALASTSLTGAAPAKTVTARTRCGYKAANARMCGAAPLAP